MPNWKKVIVSGSDAILNQVTASSGVLLPDDVKLNFGDENDLQIHHDGSNSYIKDAGTGNIFYRSGTQTFQNAAGSKTMLTLNAANSVDLNYNNSTKLQTANLGISVTGNIQASGTISGSDYGENVSGSATSTGSFGHGFIADNLYVGDQAKVYTDGTTVRYINRAAGDTLLTTFDSNEKIHLDSDGYMKFETAGSEAVRIDSSQRVGIGTDSPSALMHIKGGNWDTQLTIQNDNADNVGIKFMEDDGTIDGYIYARDTGQIGFLDPSGNWQYRIEHDSAHEWKLNNVQYAHLNSTRLKVTGNIEATGNITGSFISASNDVRVSNDVYVGGELRVVGHITGSQISASGDVVADGDVVAYNSSDERLKDNIEVIQGSLDKIGGIRGVEFDWNDKSPGWARERGHDVGVIAQEVQKVVPEIVVERKNGYLGVDYKRLVPLLIESVKELKQEVEILKKKVN